jgi:hypothetical protein
MSSFSDIIKNKIDYFTKDSNDTIDPDILTINSLDIADGLKELLTKYGFTLKELLTISTSELSESLGIELYVARIICGAARKLSNCSCDYHI